MEVAHGKGGEAYVSPKIYHYATLYKSMERIIN